MYFKLQRYGIENGLSNIKDPLTGRFQQQMAGLHQSLCISKAGHSSLRHVRAEYKDKNRDVADFHRNTKVSLYQSKICVLKVQKKYSKMNECMKLTQQL